MLKRWKKWISERFALKPIYDTALDRRIPKTPWYYGDGASLLALLTIQIASGALMSLTYSPMPDSAYQSVQYLTEQTYLGWFIRGLHYWSAGLMVIMIFLHLFRHLFLAGYKSPREGTWMVGVLLLGAILTMSFTGYVLRWDERAIYGLRVALNIFYEVPVIGHWLVILIQGSPDAGAHTLTRIYAVHVILLPLMILALTAYHVYLVIYHGITSPAERRQPVHSAEHQKALYEAASQSPHQGEKFWPFTALQSGAMAMSVVTFAVLLTLFLGPARLYPEANLTSTTMPREEWWFAWYSGLMAQLSPGVASIFLVGFPVGIFLLFLLLPLLDKRPHRGYRRRPVWATIVVLSLITLILLTDLRRRSDWTAWPEKNPPPIPEGIKLDERVEKGRQLFATYGCNSCHSVAGHGSRMAPDLARLERRLSQEHLKNFIANPPYGVAMPAYGARLTAEELQLLAEYVLVAQTFPRETR